MKLNAQTLKAIGAAIVVCAAFAIMLPGFVSYAMSLSRVIILIGTVLVVAVVLGQVVGRLSRRSAHVSQEERAVGESQVETDLSSARENKMES